MILRVSNKGGDDDSRVEDTRVHPRTFPRQLSIFRFVDNSQNILYAAYCVSSVIPSQSLSKRAALHSLPSIDKGSILNGDQYHFSSISPKCHALLRRWIWEQFELSKLQWIGYHQRWQLQFPTELQIGLLESLAQERLFCLLTSVQSKNYSFVDLIQQRDFSFLVQNPYCMAQNSCLHRIQINIQIVSGNLFNLIFSTRGQSTRQTIAILPSIGTVSISEIYRQAGHVWDFFIRCLAPVIIYILT